MAFILEMINGSIGVSAMTSRFVCKHSFDLPTTSGSRSIPLAAKQNKHLPRWTCSRRRIMLRRAVKKSKTFKYSPVTSCQYLYRQLQNQEYRHWFCDQYPMMEEPSIQYYTKRTRNSYLGYASLALYDIHILLQ